MTHKTIFDTLIICKPRRRNYRNCGLKTEMGNVCTSEYR